MDKWVENPYWQYFCGEEVFQREFPCHPTSLVKWRKQVEPEDIKITLVAPNVVAVNRQHFLNFRLDFDVDGPVNSVAEMNVAALPQGENNPQANAFDMGMTPLESETAAVRDMSLAR